MKRSSVRPSVCPTACGGFAAERRAGGKYRSTAAALGRSTALSSKCEQRVPLSPRGREGNRRSGVALALRHSLQ